MTANWFNMPHDVLAHISTRILNEVPGLNRVVYDITNKESFNGAKSWVKELQRRGDPNVIIALAGNKADLQNKRRVESEVNRLWLALFQKKHKSIYGTDIF